MAVRRAKLEALRAEGIPPFAERYARTHTLAEARALAEAQGEDDAATTTVLPPSSRSSVCWSGPSSLPSFVLPFHGVVSFKLTSPERRTQAIQWL